MASLEADAWAANSEAARQGRKWQAAVDAAVQTTLDESVAPLGRVLVELGGGLRPREERRSLLPTGRVGHRYLG